MKKKKKKNTSFGMKPFFLSLFNFQLFSPSLNNTSTFKS